MKSRSALEEQLINTVRLLSESQQERLLAFAQSLIADKRKNRRKTYIMYVDYSDEKRFERGIIQNISSSGMYIKPSSSFAIGQTIIMTFDHPENSNPIKLRGTIVWKDGMGMGVKFLREIEVR